MLGNLCYIVFIYFLEVRDEKLAVYCIISSYYMLLYSIILKTVK